VSRRPYVGLLFFVWLYGVPFLLIAGFIRRLSSPPGPWVGLFIAALVVNLACPVAGIILARDAHWRRHFGWAFAAVPIYLIALLPLSGSAPEEPAPHVSHCIPISGGHQCPGG
jgi:hypothetical protein